MTQRVRLWVFRVATAIAVPVVLIVIVEASLRLFGYGYSSEFTVPCTVQGRGAYCDNDRFTWQFFPPGAFRLPPAFAIPAEKSPGTFRIFIVGESAAQGDPEPSYAFSRYLEVMLRERFPTVHFEVINTGITAINSHVLFPVTRDLARHRGDLFVLYLGNNEVVGPFGAGNTLNRPSMSLALVRTGIFLKSTRLGQLLGAALRSSVNDGDPGAWRGMEMFLEQQVPLDANAMARVYEHFRSNLIDIIKAAREGGASVVVSTVAVNLKDSAPFASLHRSDLTADDGETWETQVREGIALEEADQHAEALQRYLSAAAIDDRHAELQFRIGRVYWALGEFTAARERLNYARDLDVLRFRADSRINSIIRSVVAAGGAEVKLVDAEKLFAEASPYGIPGHELFYEHVHMKPRGNYLLARALFPHVVALLPDEVQWPAVEPPSELETERLLALTSFDRRQITRTVIGWLSQPPFTNRLNNDEQIRELQHELKTVREDLEETASTYSRAIARAPDDRWLHFNYGIFLQRQGDFAGAAEAFRRALELLPGNYAARSNLADALVQMGRFEEAVTQCRQLLRRMPYHPPAYLTMAYALARLEAFNESIAAYERAIQLQPAYALDAYTNIGNIQLHQGRFDNAAASFQKALDLDPDRTRAADLLYHLSYSLKQLGRNAEAQRALEGALASGWKR